jgi:HPt (histidine-containing phosphotransfer) domain-containing protein
VRVTTIDNDEDKSSPLLAFIDRLPAGVREKLALLYLESLARESALILDALQKGELQAAGALAHKLWGGAANLQDLELARVAKLIEVAAIEQKLDAANKAALALPSCCSISMAVLQRYVPQRKQ